MINRRSFTTLLLFFVTSSTSFLLSGCNVFSDILNWVPVGEAALSSIVLVLSSNGIIISPQVQSIITNIRAGFDALVAAVNEYRSTTPAPVGALARVEAAFKSVIDSFSSFLASLNVSSSLLGVVVGLSQIVLSTIAAFVNRLPPSMGLISARASVNAATIGNKPLVVVPKERNTGRFKKDFNAVLKSAPVDVNVPSNSYL